MFAYLRRDSRGLAEQTHENRKMRIIFIFEKILPPLTIFAESNLESVS
jgi:hypothetical protein